MPEETDEIVGTLGRALVSDLAPEELPLFPALLGQFQGARGKTGKQSSGDQLLGFGGAEVLIMLTPVILSFAKSFWQALAAEAAQGSAHGISEYVKAHLHGRHDAVAVRPLTAEQLKLVRTVAEHEARRLEISEGQAGLFADAMVGVLAAPVN
jgi:hypothetical protein